MTHRTAAIVWMVIAAAVVAAAAILWDRVARDPDLRLLRAHDGIHWIKYPEPPSLRVRHLGEYQTAFRLQRTVDHPPDEAWLTVRSLADASVYVNDHLALARHRDPAQWKRPRTVNIAPYMDAGANVILVQTVHENGPRLLWARCDALNIATGAEWQVSDDGETWRHAVPAHQTEPSELSRRFPRPGVALARILPFLVPVFLLVFAYNTAHRAPVIATLRPYLTAARFRWGLIAAWAVLAVNNIMKIEPVVGFDIEGHMNYIHFIPYHGRLPLAHEGWQTFQAPLYYLASAGPYWLLSKWFSLETVIKLLRFVPLLCGIVQIEIGYRLIRRVFPERNDLQMAGAFIAAFLPINLYITQYIGNEPLAAVFTALACLQSVRLLTEKELNRPLAQYALLGAWVGLAILTKFTAILLIPPTALVIAYHAKRSANGPATVAATAAARGLTVMALVVAAVAGWYFARNALHYGKPFVGGWETAREIIWWQDPGYRTPAQFFTFGEALVRPVFAGTAGLWDAFYSTLWLDGLLSSMVEYEHRPPWNDNFLIAGAWLGLFPTVLLIAGVARAMVSDDPANRLPLRFALACLSIYGAAFAYLYLILPIYSTGKATYTLGLTPLYAMLIVAGLDRITARTTLRATAYAALAVWGAAAYAAYFVIR